MLEKSNALIILTPKPPPPNHLSRWEPFTASTGQSPSRWAAASQRGQASEQEESGEIAKRSSGLSESLTAKSEDAARNGAAGASGARERAGSSSALPLCSFGCEEGGIWGEAFGVTAEWERRGIPLLPCSPELEGEPFISGRRKAPRTSNNRRGKHGARPQPQEGVSPASLQPSPVPRGPGT